MLNEKLAVDCMYRKVGGGFYVKRLDVSWIERQEIIIAAARLERNQHADQIVGVFTPTAEARRTRKVYEIKMKTRTIEEEGLA